MSSDLMFACEAIGLEMSGRPQDAHDALNELTTDQLAEFANACSTLEMVSEQIIAARAVLDA